MFYVLKKNKLSWPGGGLGVVGGGKGRTDPEEPNLPGMNVETCLGVDPMQYINPIRVGGLG